MSYVIVTRNEKNVPNAVQLTTAMIKAGAKVDEIDGTDKERKVTYTGTPNYTMFKNTLIELVPGAGQNSWTFDWVDTIAEAIRTADFSGLDDYSKSILLLNAVVAATQKKVTIKIDHEDLRLLKNSAYRLCFAKKVGEHDYNVVWQSYTDYLPSNTFSWTPEYELFGSNEFESNVRVDVSTNIVRIGLGETSLLDDVGVLGEPATGGPSTSITLRNEFGPIHPGINQLSKSSIGGGGAVSTPIYVAENQVVTGDTELTPVEKVLVWFEQNIETSTMFSKSRSKAIEVDLRDTDSATRLYSKGAWTTPPKF